MSIDPVVLNSIIAVVSQLGAKVTEGAATEVEKDTWGRIKALCGWSSDPAPKEIPAKVQDAVATSPALLEKLEQLLKAIDGQTTATLIGNLEARDSKVVVAHSVDTLNM
jgi:hypothetical protein